MVNGENYPDPTADSAIGIAESKTEAKKRKIYYLMQNIRSTCKLAGFELVGSVYVTDANGISYDAQAVSYEVYMAKKNHNNVENVQPLREDT